MGNGHDEERVGVVTIIDRREPPKISERLIQHETIAGLYRQGKTQQEISEMFGCTRQNVGASLKRSGLIAGDGGVAEQRRRRAYESDAARDAECLERWGCTYAQYKTIRGTVTRSFQYSRQGARQRGIGWEFTLWEWWQTWSTSGKWPERGQGSNSYCMCRFGDVGPYATWNVYIATNFQNLADSRENRRVT